MTKKPRKPAGEKLVARSVKVSDVDWAEWTKAAASEGMGVSAWVRLIARRAIRRARKAGEL